MKTPKRPVPQKRDLSLLRVVAAIRPAPSRYIVWDIARTGLGLDVWPAGRRTWVYQYRNAAGVQRRAKLGDAATMTPDQADAAYAAARAVVALGGDPLTDRRALKASTKAARADRLGAATVLEVGERYLTSLARSKSARWAAEARRIVTKDIVPTLGARLVRDLTAKDVKALHASMHKHPVAANRTRAVLSAILSRAIADGDRPHDSRNPGFDVTDYPEAARDRYLRADEWPRMAAAIAATRAALATAPAWDTRAAQLDALITLALTGARLRAVLPRRWVDVDAGEHVLRVIPAHKTVTEIPLGAAARAHLTAMRLRDNPAPDDFLFPGQQRAHRKRTPVSGLDVLWRDLRARAGVTDFTLHDWRRSFATVAGDVGITDHMIGGLLGHAVPGIRGRYARRTGEALVRAADTVSAEVAKRLRLNLVVTD